MRYVMNTRKNIFASQNLSRKKVREVRTRYDICLTVCVDR